MANGSPVTLAFGLAGVALAPVFGATALVGAQYGLAIGALLDPGPQSDAGRAADSRFGGSTLGSAVPIVWGRYRVTCPIIWIATNPDGSVNTVVSGGGKGGKGGVADTYYSFAVVGCQGSMLSPSGASRTRNPVVDKVWAADLVLYNVADSTHIFTPTFHPSGGETFDDQGRDSTISTWLGVDQTPTYRPFLYAVFDNLDTAQFGGTIPRIDFELHTDAVSVADVFSDICWMAGIDSSKFDATAVADIMVTGYVVPSTMSFQDMVTGLLLPFGIDMVAHSNKVYLVPRGGAAVFDVPAGDLNASRDQQTSAPALTVKGANYVERYTRCDLTYYDQGRNFQATVAPSPRVMTAFTPNVLRMSTNMVFDSVTARQRAAFLMDTADVEAEGREIRFTLPWSYLKLVPGDALTIPWLDDATTGALSDTVKKRVRVLETGIGAGENEGLLQVTACRDEIGVLDQSQITDGVGVAVNVPTVGAQPVSIDFYAFSPSKGLFDADQTTTAGIVVVANSSAASWRATAYYSIDGGTTWSPGAPVPSRGVWGTLQSSHVPADWSGSAGGLDGTSQADFIPAGSSASYAPGYIPGSFPSASSGDFNRYAIASELVTATTVTGPSSSKYTLSSMYRAWRSSPSTGHAAGEKVVWLGDRANRPYLWLPMPASAVGNTVKVKVLGIGQALSDVTAVDVTVSPIPAPVTGPPTAPDSVSVTKSWPDATHEQLTFAPVFGAAPTFPQTYEWQTATSSDGITWSSWSSSSTSSSGLAGPTFTSGYMKARVRAANSYGNSSWVESSSTQFASPPGTTTIPTPYSETKSGDGSTTAFTLAHAPNTSWPLFVFVDNVLQRPADYSLSGTTLTFTVAPYTGTNNIDLRYWY